MHLISRFTGPVFCFAVLCLGSAVSAQADPLTIVISNPDSLQTAPGSSILLSGTITNNTNAVLFLNASGASVNVNQPAGSNIVSSVTFFIGPTLTTYVLQPGQTTGVVPLMILHISPLAPSPSITAGGFGICGGASASACEQLGSVVFNVGVGRPPEPSLPEPATVTLLGTGLAGIAAGVWRRRRARRRS